MINNYWQISEQFKEILVDEDFDKGVSYVSNIVKKPMVLGLLGEIGSGKTTFVKETLQLCDIKLAKQVSSPTYSYLNVYNKDFKDNSNLIFAHMDLYRVNGSEHLLQIGIWDIINDNNMILFVEWADKFQEILDQCQIIIEFKTSSFISDKITIYQNDQLKNKELINQQIN